VDRVWDEGIPKALDENKGLHLEDARRFCRDAYSKEGEHSIRWYQLDYWLRHFDLKNLCVDGLISAYAPRITLFEEALPVLTCLQRYGGRMLIFSNATRPFIGAEIKHIGIEDFFEAIISLSQ
jgi:FMN phosphatase YigB (HAD superfamily)